VLLPLPTGRTVIEEVIHRAKQINGVDEVVVAIPEKDAAILERYISVRCVKGSETDVLSRYWVAAKEAAADVIVRITADCPLLDPKVCADVIATRARLGVEYASNVYPSRSFPQGYDCEVFTVEALMRAEDATLTWHEMEHVGPWLQKNCTIALHKAMDDRAGERLTLDSINDFRNIYELMLDELNAGHRAA
jgi:spore coat polysaccharide biosynthesis protein SpsF (cytidylyltransferase family)